MLRRDDSGQALTTAIILLAVSFVMGAALLALVDTQSGATGVQRERDASFNAAESVLTATRFALAKEWPAKKPGSTNAWPWVTTSCSTQDIASTTTSGGGLALAQQIGALVTQEVQAHQPGATVKWSVFICDNATATTYSDANVIDNAASPAAGYDAGKDNEVWVRAQATVNNRPTAIASLVTRAVGKSSSTTTGTTGPTGPTGPTGVTGVSMPTQYSLIAGRTDFTGTASPDNAALLTNTDFKTSFDNILLQLDSNGVLQNDNFPNGLGALRCTTLTTECVSPNPVNDVPLLDNTLTDRTRVVPYGSETVAGPQAIAAIKAYASGQGTAYSSWIDGSSCLPLLGVPSNPGVKWVVYIDKIGNGDGTCTINAALSPQIVALVVGSGRIHVTGTPYSMLNTVLYDENLQSVSDRKQREVITVDNGVRVQGAVWIDGGGTFGFGQPTTNLKSIIDNGDTGNYLNNLYGQVKGAAYKLTMDGEPAASQLADLVTTYKGVNNFSQLVQRVSDQVAQTHVSPVTWEQDRINRLNKLIATVQVTQTVADTSANAAVTGGVGAAGTDDSSDTSNDAGTVSNTSSTFQQIAPR